MRRLLRRLTGMAAVLTAAMAMGGCLAKETETTITLQPDGSGTWAVVDRDVRATSGKAAERLREEQEFLANAQAGRHEPATALANVGCSDVSTTVLRARWPYMVATDCRFADLGAVFQRLLDRSGMTGQSWLETTGERMVWRFSLDAAGEERASSTDQDQEALALLLGADKTRVFLRRGRFVEAAGFEIDDDGHLATMKPIDDEAVEKAGALVLSLTWTTGDSR